MCRPRSVEYVNRMEVRYFLHVGKTKTGKPKYFCSRKAPAAPLEEMPEGYEWWENPEQGNVSVRKSRLFLAERWCFLGSIDRWVGLSSPPMPLAALIDAYAENLGKETFYELI